MNAQGTLYWVLILDCILYTTLHHHTTQCHDNINYTTLRYAYHTASQRHTLPKRTAHYTTLHRTVQGYVTSQPHHTTPYYATPHYTHTTPLHSAIHHNIAPHNTILCYTELCTPHRFTMPYTTTSHYTSTLHHTWLHNATPQTTRHYDTTTKKDKAT